MHIFYDLDVKCHLEGFMRWRLSPQLGALLEGDWLYEHGSFVNELVHCGVHRGRGQNAVGRSRPQGMPFKGCPVLRPISHSVLLCHSHCLLTDSWQWDKLTRTITPETARKQTFALFKWLPRGFCLSNKWLVNTPCMNVFPLEISTKGGGRWKFIKI